MSARIAIDGDVVQVLDADACFLQAMADRLGGEARPMLDPAKALLFHRRNQLASAEQAGRGVGVVGVNPEDVHYVRLRRCALSPAFAAA
jgi:hypothetical protein